MQNLNLNQEQIREQLNKLKKDGTNKNKYQQ